MTPEDAEYQRLKKAVVRARFVDGTCGDGVLTWVDRYTLGITPPGQTTRIVYKSALVELMWLAPAPPAT